MALYANVGAELTRWEVDVPAATLTRRESVRLPGNVQYAWPHRSRRALYVATSTAPDGDHHLLALRIDAGTGALAPLGAPLRLPSRPIHLCTDPPSAHVLVAFNDPSAVRVYRIGADLRPGPELAQPEPVEVGTFAHQVLVTPDGRSAIAVARGNGATPTRTEQPGRLTVFDYADGTLRRGVPIAPGAGFGPRHLAFHPTRPWAYLSIELQNEIALLHLAPGRLGPDRVGRVSTLAGPDGAARQAAGAIHVHPAGHVVYVANRTDGAGENGIAVFRIDGGTGLPRPVQHVDTRGIHPRTFQLDPSGRLLVAQHNRPVALPDGAGTRLVQAGLSVFGVAADGTLAFARRYDVDVGASSMFWMGMVPL